MKFKMFIVSAIVAITMVSFNSCKKDDLKTDQNGIEEATLQQKPGQSTSISATDEQIRLACTNAFEGKCLRGGTVDLTNFFNIEQVQSYCGNSTFCSYQECTTRLSIILGLGSTIDNTNNPCVPSS